MNDIIDINKNGISAENPNFIFRRKYAAIRRSTYAQRVDLARKVVCNYFGVPLQELDSRRRTTGTVAVRHACMYLLYVHCPNMSLAKIGSSICPESPFDHTTILHALKRISGLVETDKSYKERLNAIEASFVEAMNEIDNNIYDPNKYYYLDMDKASVYSLGTGKAVVFVGLDANEISKMPAKMSRVNFTPSLIEFSGTGIRIIKKKNENEH